MNSCKVLCANAAGADPTAAGHCGPLLAGRLAALASMRQLRRSSVGESPDVIMCSSIEGVQQGGRAQQQGVRVRHRAFAASGSSAAGSSRGSLLGSSARPVAAILDVSTSGCFLQQQLRQIRGIIPQHAGQVGQQQRDPAAAGSGNSSAAGGDMCQQGQRPVSAPTLPAAAAADKATGGLPVGSPIEGLGALRRSLNQLPAGVSSRPGSAAALRLSWSEQRLSYERASQQDMQQQQQLTLEEQASMVLGRLLNSGNLANSSPS